MPKIVTPLTDTQVKNAIPKPKNRPKEYSLADGHGLYLRVNPVGTKQWLFNYQKPFTKQRTNKGLGSYPYVSLAEARAKRLEYKTLLAQKIDPQEYELEKQLEGERAYSNTFKAVADKWFKIREIEVTPAYAEDLYNSLVNHIFPKLGNIPVHKITAPLVIAVLDPIAAMGKREMIKRLCQRLNMIMNFAINTGIIPKGSNPLIAIKENYAKPDPIHFATLAVDELPTLLRAVNDSGMSVTVRSLFYWQLHTMARPAEAAGARWEEIDLENGLWIIPAERMKRRKEHKVLLTPQTTELLNIMRPISGSGEFVFPSPYHPKNHVNNESVNTSLKRMGFKGQQTSHGIRALCSTTLNEQAFDADLIEVALSHGDSSIRGVYNRPEYLERRRVMMQWLSLHIEAAATGVMPSAGKKHLRMAS